MGSNGTLGSQEGFDSIVQEVTGIAVLESPDGDHPGVMSARALDHAGGHFLAAALSHCLKQQRHEGGSWSVDLARAPCS